MLSILLLNVIEFDVEVIEFDVEFVLNYVDFFLNFVEFLFDFDFFVFLSWLMSCRISSCLFFFLFIFFSLITQQEYKYYWRKIFKLHWYIDRSDLQKLCIVLLCPVQTELHCKWSWLTCYNRNICLYKTSTEVRMFTNNGKRSILSLM